MGDLTFREQLERHNDPDEVRQRIAAGNYNPQKAKVAKEWLDSLDRAEEQSIVSRTEARDEEALSLARSADETAKEALRISTHNRNISVGASIVAVVAALASIVGAFK
jgi:hypothetical protein